MLAAGPEQLSQIVPRAVVAGLLAWFVLDSAGSIASGNASNAFFNVVVLLVTVGPLWRPTKVQSPETPEPIR